MINLICNSLINKKILILGFGREGKSTYRFIRKHMPDQMIGIYDKNAIQEILENVTIHGGDSFYDILSEYDLIIKSPGIVLKLQDEAILKKITSQTDLFLEFYRDQVIGITGTKGKSTTAALLYHVLQNTGKDTLLAGNIGIPVFDVLENIREKTLVVFEFSSHQLEYATHSPHIGVLLNIYEEHLDHYGSFEKYKAAKENIYRFQQTGDLLLYNKEFFALPKNFRADMITISNTSSSAQVVIKNNKICHQGDVYEIKEEEILLKGKHNFYNIGAAYTLARKCGVDDSQFREAMKSFQPLPHRLEYVGEVNGIKFYNDSISTICETTIQAVNSLDDVDTVILGGMDRGIAYEPLTEYLVTSTIRNIILMPDTGYRIGKLLQESGKLPDYQKLIMVSNVQDAVVAAKKETQSQKTCLFSPAAASYGFFKNFEERGEVFKKCVLE